MILTFTIGLNDKSVWLRHSHSTNCNSHTSLIASFQCPQGRVVEGESGGVGVEEEQGTKGTKRVLCFGANVNWIMLKYVLLVVCGL